MIAITRSAFWLLPPNRHGLVVDAMVTTATGTAEREAAVEMITAAITAEPDVSDGAFCVLGYRLPVCVQSEACHHILIRASRIWMVSRRSPLTGVRHRGRSVVSRTTL